MSVVKIALLAGGMSLALATGAFAQARETGAAESTDQWNLDTIPEGTGVMMATAKGTKSTKLKIGKKGHTQLMASKSAIELPSKTMIYKKNGKLYLVTDRKMPEGNMLFDQTKGWAGD
jgi:hypothetical protein